MPELSPTILTEKKSTHRSGTLPYLLKQKKLKLDENLTVYVGGGCNSVVLTSKDGKEAIVVDTKWFRSAKALRAAVKAPKVTVINTHFHLDHARGNKLYPSAYVISGETNWKHWDWDTNRSKRPDKALKPGEELSIRLDDEIIHVVAVGKAHSANDLVVYLSRRRLLAVGDLVCVNMHPPLVDPKGSVACWREALDKIEKDFAIDTLVPGHGAVGTRDSLSSMKDYFSRIANALNDPQELRQLKSVYKSYKTFPKFVNFDRTVKVMRKEMASGPE